MKHLYLTLAILSLALGTRAQTLQYWDNNGTTAGAGSGTTWTAASTTWTTSAGGTIATAAWGANNRGRFSAGSDLLGVAYTVTVSGTHAICSIEVDDGQAVTLTGGTLTLVPNGTVTLPRIFTVFANASQSITINSILAGANGLEVRLGAGSAGTVRLGGANTYTGATLFNHGTGANLRNVASEVIPNGSDLTVGSSVAVNWFLDNFNETINSLAGNGSTINLGSGTLTINDGAGKTFAGTISGTSGNLTKNGSGSLTLSGSTLSATGTLTIGGGDLNLTSASSYTLGFTSIAIGTGAALAPAGTGGTKTIGGTISGNGEIKKSGASTAALTGNNSYAGNTLITGGKISVGSATALGSTAGYTEASVGGEVLFTGAGTTFTCSENFRIAGDGAGDSGAIAVIASATPTLSGTITLIGDATNTVSGSSTVTFNNAAAFTSLANQNLTLQGGSGAGGGGTISGVIALGSGGLTKYQGGTWNLSGVNTYTGPTAINAGRINVNSPGSLAAGSTVTVAVGATLGGTGTVGGPTTVNGTVAPGTSIGTLTFTVAPTLSGTTSMEIDRAGVPNADKLVVSTGGGTLAYGGTLTVVNVGGTIQAGDTFDLFDADSFSGSFATVNLPSVPGLTWDTSQLTVNGTISVTCANTLVASAGSDQTICSGSGVAIGGSPTASSGSGSGYTYLWDNAGSLSSATDPNPTASPTTTTTYTVTVTDSVGCTAQDSVTVTVNTVPSITGEPSATNVCSGSPASFTVAASGGDLNYLWRKRGTGWGSGNDWQLTASGGNSGFFVADSSANGSGSSGNINTSAKAWGMYANSGDTASAVRAFGSSMSVGQTFKLDMDNGFIDSGSTVGFGLRNASGENVWEFYFVGGASSYTINAGSVSPTPNIPFTADGLRVEVTLTSSTTYSAKVTTNGVLEGTYTGNLLSPGGGQAITQARLFNANAGSGSSKDAYFNSITLRGLDDNAAAYSSWSNTDNKGNSPLANGGNISGATTTTLAINPATASDAADYDVVIYNTCGQSNSAIAALTVNAAATANAGADQTICSADTVTLAGSIGGSATSATWSGGAGSFNPNNTTLNAVYTPDAGEVAAGTVTLTLTTDDPSGPCLAAVDTVTISIATVTANTASYQRNAGSSLKIYLANLLTHASNNLAQTITFLGVGTDGFNLTSTNGSTLTTNATFIGYTNSVTPNAPDGFSYKVTDPQGCVTLGTVLINVVTNPAGLVQTIDTSGGSVTVGFSGIPTYQYVVERADDVIFSVNVTNLSTNIAPANGQFSITDNSPPPVSGYYRLRYNP